MTLLIKIYILSLLLVLIICFGLFLGLLFSILSKRKLAKKTEILTKDNEGLKDKIISLQLNSQTLQRLNEKFNNLALRDYLTELYNYKYAIARLETEFARSKYGLNFLSILFIDIDYFSSVNDTYGRIFGDKILVQVADLLREHLESNAIIARYSGEEFLVILLDTPKYQATEEAKMIHSKLVSHQFRHDGSSAYLSISIGVASFPEDHATSAMQLVDFANKALCLSKEKGGNKVSIFIQELFTDKEKKVLDESLESLKYKLEHMSKASKNALVEYIYALANAIRAKDSYTAQHSEDMVNICAETAKKIGLDEDAIENIKYGAMLHDLGKIGISEKILLKKSELTPEERNQIMKHSQIGADIIRSIHVLKDVVPNVLYHHERYDGKGYPMGLKEEEIPIGARIIAVADAYQALASDRPYRNAYTKRQAIDILKEESGTHFDPKIVKVFLSVINKDTW